MNNLQIVQRLHRESGRSTAPPTSITAATVSQLRLFDAVNDFWKDLQLERSKDWKWMRQPLTATLTPGVARYTGAALGAVNFSRWRPEADDYYVRCSPPGSAVAWWQVEQMTLDAFKQARYDVLVNSSTPVAFTIDNDQTLWLWPQPAAAYGIKIDAISKPIDLVADTDVPGMPDEFHMLLVWGALLTIAITDAAPEVMQKAQMHHDMLRQRLVLDQGRVPCL